MRVKCTSALAAVAVVAAIALPNRTFGVFDYEEILGRGDANNDLVVNVSDANFILTYLQYGTPVPPCANQADADDDGYIMVADAVYLLNWLYAGGPAPPYPGPFNTECKADTTFPNLDCFENCYNL